ncbi:hypothetical protein AB0J38_41270 [Streptomyces sp. NPDC050095]|uniref:hypothetical protein n=1 Tax=unclassified Streptomyces TaxID=2593676 RepID=UPI0034383557
MPETVTRNFLGMPVSGKLCNGSTRKDQSPVEDLAPALQALLDDPTIAEFGWTQYTPFFNDGDVCEFSVNELWVRTMREADSECDDYDLYWGYHPSLGRELWEWRGQGEERTYVRIGYEGPDEERFQRVKDLNHALVSGHYDAALLGAFGDHAIVTVRKDRIQVEFYEHD